MTVASHVPIDFSQVPGLDKMLHATAFAGLAFLLGRYLLSENYPRWTLAVLMVAVVAYATCDELSQLWIPLRVCDAGDWLADIVGASIGIVAVFARQVRVYNAGDPSPSGHTTGPPKKDSLTLP